MEICMTEKRFTLGVCEKGLGLSDNLTKEQYLELDDKTLFRLCELLNELHEENEQLKKELSDCQKTKAKRLRRVKHQRAVLEEMGAVNMGYKGELKQLHYKINQIKETMEDTGVLTKRELEEILK